LLALLKSLIMAALTRLSRWQSEVLVKDYKIVVLWHETFESEVLSAESYEFLRWSVVSQSFWFSVEVLHHQVEKSSPMAATLDILMDIKV